MFAGTFFRTRNIHTLRSPVLCLCWPLGCLVVSLCLWVSFLERGVFTHLSPCLLWWSVMSRLGSSRSAPTWRLISDCHDPPTFSGVGVHYLKFTSALPFRNMTSGVTVETVGEDSWRVVPIRWPVTIRCAASPLLRPVTDRVYWTCMLIVGRLSCVLWYANWGSGLPFFFRERGSNYAWAECYLQQNTFRRYFAWADHYL